MHLERIHVFDDPFSRCWQKVPALSQGNLIHSLQILPNLLTDWQTRE